jgi:hypothetical protein
LAAQTQSFTGRTASPEELAWERKRALPSGVAGIAAAILFLIALFVRGRALRSSSNDADKVLQTAHKHSSAVYTSGVLQAIATALLALLVIYLWRCARHRLPQTPGWIFPVVVAGAIAVAVLGLLSQYEIVQAAKEFVTQKPKTPNLDAITNPQAYLHAVQGLDPKQRAEDVSSAHFGAGLQAIFLLCNLVLGVPVLFANLWAMRAGLLSRFMGVLGIIVGALYCLPILGGGGGFVQIPWAGAAGLMVLGVWPGRRGDAWATGEPLPWISSAQMRVMQKSAEQAGSKNGREQERTIAADEPVSDGGVTRSSRKRKRKQGRKH